MMLILSASDFALLSPSAQAELMALWQGAHSTPSAVQQEAQDWRRDPAIPPEINMSNVIDFSFEQVSEFMSGAHERTQAGLRVFAEHGPVIDARLLSEAGVKNIRHFQSRVTTRTRTVSGNPNAFLFGWDKWSWDPDGHFKSGRYAITPTTYLSLRRYFGLN